MTGARAGWRGRVVRAVAGVAVAAVLAAGLAGCTPRPRVYVYGDSLAWESAKEIRQWAAARGYDAVLRTRFGGAPCSLFAEMRADRNTRPRMAIISFAGNSNYLAPCVGTSHLASYRAQMQEVQRIWTGSGTRLAWVSTPRLPVAYTEDAQDVMRSEAQRLGMVVGDGGKYVSPNRVWAWTQPCMAGERCVGRQLNGAVAPGRNIVRANDRVHFCPGPSHGFDPCSTYSSGSWRFARALTEVLPPPR